MKHLDIRARESRPLVLSALCFFFILTAYYIIRPVRDQLSGAVGSTSLPIFYSATFVATLLLTPVFGMLVARFPRRQLMLWSYSFFIVCLLAFVPAFVFQDQIGAKLLGTVFFVWVSVFNLFVVSLFWSLMADIWTSHQARRLFSMVALGGTAGALAGPIITSLLVKVLGVAPLLVVSAVLLTVALGLLLRLSSDDEDASRESAKAIGGSLLAGARQVMTQPFLRNMALLMLLNDGIGTVAYALVADYAKAHYVSDAARTAMYAHLDLAINVLGALMQISLTRWILYRLSVTWGLVIPALVNVVLLLMVVVWGRDMRVFGTVVSLVLVLQVVARGTQYGMLKPATDSLYTRIAREARYKGKNFVETAVWRFGDLFVTTSLNLLRGIGVTLTGLAAISAGLSGVAAWIGVRASHSSDLLEEAPETGGVSERPGP
ncbi:MFS transporter [Oleiagrimonas sp.]|jgi:AAA family ATP:ADP antiporter|uniref:NTP/NDP exchange transporter n=1 Tax=Oleiagrimonas sp. TaxID=2010330 RepID=UPI002619964B|nr:MFS transporter [Oleiagrimonas sp.]MDA3913146.1 MFS transporter [Oleiagrimonas sp.]